MTYVYQIHESRKNVVHGHYGPDSAVGGEYPGPGGKWQISTEGGAEPVWNSSGRELFYRGGDKMMSVEITMELEFSPAKPRLLFERAYEKSPLTGFSNYDVTPDGQRFVMIGSEDVPAPTELTVVLNWFEELKRLVPTEN